MRFRRIFALKIMVIYNMIYWYPLLRLERAHLFNVISIGIRIKIAAFFSIRRNACDSMRVNNELINLQQFLKV